MPRKSANKRPCIADYLVPDPAIVAEMRAALEPLKVGGKGKKRITAADAIMNEKFLLGGELKTRTEIIRELKRLGGEDHEIGCYLFGLDLMKKLHIDAWAEAAAFNVGYQRALAQWEAQRKGAKNT